jgi:spore coat protein JB
MMENNHNRSCCGRLPEAAPLAVPFVPFQVSDPEVYTAKWALIRGTLYPCLDLPFMGMVNTEEQSDTAMHELQALRFAMHELGLYLDTHADDEQAAALFETYADTYRRGMERFQAECGALRQENAVVNGRYTWTEGPWPWELSANQEG